MIVRSKKDLSGFLLEKGSNIFVYLAIQTILYYFFRGILPVETAVLASILIFPAYLAVLLIALAFEKYKEKKVTPKPHIFSKKPEDPINVLTARDWKYLELMSLGMKAKDIAEYLYLQIRVTESIINNIKCKLNCNRKSELLALYATLKKRKPRRFSHMVPD